MARPALHRAAACAAALTSAASCAQHWCHSQAAREPPRRAAAPNRRPAHSTALRQAPRDDLYLRTRPRQQLRLRRGRHATFPVRINGVWYDLARFRRKHPAGAHFIDYYEGRDATEPVYAFHGEGVRRFVGMLPRLDDATSLEMEAAAEPVSDVALAFRELRRSLEEEGWWERDLAQEGLWLLIWASLFLGGLALAQVPAWGATLAVLPLALAAIQGAWLGHDYAHGCDDFCRGMRLFAPLAIGISPTWWGDKHNNHHALTNQMGADRDLSMPPLLLWAPHPDDDNALRSSQHCWFFLGCMYIFFSWRARSLASAAQGALSGRRGAAQELVALCVHWAVLLSLVPLGSICAFVALAGLVCGTIITTSHMNEELHSDFQQDWVSAQFRSTRDATTRSPFTEWLWGGMQYHIEHHLFPTMPRSRYPALAPILRDFAQRRGIPGGHREEDELRMVSRTWERLRQLAEGPDGGQDAARLYDSSEPTGIAYKPGQGQG